MVAWACNNRLLPEGSESTLMIEYIIDQVQKTIKKYAETNPVRLAKAMKIIVSYRPLGTAEGCIKGFFVIVNRIKHITINSDLPEELQKVILAHEIGHAVLHKKEAQGAAFHELMLFDSVDHKEYEANIFASELLLSNEDVMDAINEDQFFFDAAKQLCVPPEMLDFKFRIMKKQGFKVESPIISNGDFLKHAERMSENCHES